MNNDIITVDATGSTKIADKNADAMKKVKTNNWKHSGNSRSIKD